MVRALASHHLDRFKSWRQRHLWVEFVVASLPCCEGFFQIISNSIWNTWTHSKKFSRTSRCFVGKQITKNDGIISRHPALNNLMSIKYELQ